MIPPKQGHKVTLRPMGRISKITTCSVKFLGKYLGSFISEDDKIVYNYRGR